MFMFFLETSVYGGPFRLTVNLGEIWLFFFSGEAWNVHILSSQLYLAMIWDPGPLGHWGAVVWH